MIKRQEFALIYWVISADVSDPDEVSRTPSVTVKIDMRRPAGGAIMLTRPGLN